MPVVYLGHTDEVQFFSGINFLMQRHRVQIDAIADTDGALPEYLLLVGEGDDGLQLAGQTAAEHLVETQLEPFCARKALKLLIVGIGGNLHHSLDASLLQPTEETDKEGVGIHETAGIDHPYLLTDTIAVDGTITDALAKTSQFAGAEVLDGGWLMVDGGWRIVTGGWRIDFYQALPVAVDATIIVAEMHLVAILLEALDLSKNLLRDAADIREAVIDQKEYLHFISNHELHKFIP